MAAGRWYVCEMCDEEVPRVNEYGICPACHEWEIAQGWHQDEAAPDDDEPDDEEPRP